MKALIISIILAFGIFAAENWEGGLDTSEVLGFKAALTKYSKAFNLTDGEDIRAVIQCDDTTVAGYASDSVGIAWGFQTGVVIGNSSDALDTLWDITMYLDTLETAGFGLDTFCLVGAEGLSISRPYQVVDTSSTDGARQQHWFLPEWSPLIRYVFTGYAGNLVGEELELMVYNIRRTGVEIKK